jgi:hypothetical protein
MIVQAPGCHEDSSREGARGELAHSHVHGTTVSIVDRDCDAWTPVARLVDPFERYDICLGCEHIELHGKVSLGNE